MTIIEKCYFLFYYRGEYNNELEYFFFFIIVFRDEYNNKFEMLYEEDLGFNSLFIEKQTKLLASFISNFSMLLNRNKSILNVSIIVLDKVGRLTWRLAMLLKFLSNKIKWIAASNI